MNKTLNKRERDGNDDILKYSQARNMTNGTQNCSIVVYLHVFQDFL